jgi:hypothetical protein
MKVYGGVDVWIHILFTFALVGGEWLASRPSAISPGKEPPRTHWIWGWMGPRAGLDAVE